MNAKLDYSPETFSGISRSRHRRTGRSPNAEQK